MTEGTQDHQGLCRLHRFHSKALQGIRDPRAAREKLELWDHLVLQAPQVDLGKLVQAQWDPLDHKVLLVIQDSQGRLGFLQGLILLQENQGIQDPLGHRVLQACRDHQDQMLYTVALGTLDHKEIRAKWDLQDEEAQKEEKGMRGSVPVSLVPKAPQVLQDFLGGTVQKETWVSLEDMEKKVTRVLLVLKDFQDHQASLVPWDHLETKEKKVTWLYQELKDTKEKEVLMGPQDFRGSKDSMVKMDSMEKRGTQDSQETIKMQCQETKGHLGCQAPLAKKDLQALQDWVIQVLQEREDHQELQAAQARGALLA